MSQFIHTSGKTSSSELLKGEIIEIKTPNKRRITRQFDHSQFSIGETTKAIKRIVEKESQLGLVQHERRLRESMGDLKKRIKGFGRIEEAHIPFGQAKKPSNRRLTCLPTQSIDIQKKYNVQLTIKFNALKECENIQSYRQHMSKWKDSRWNHINRNPNFMKMNYLIARAKEEEKENELFASLEKIESSEEKTMTGAIRKRSNANGYRGFMSLSKQKQLTEH